MNGKHIMVIGEFCGDAFEWHLGVPLSDDGTMDAELQRLIDEGEQTAEYESWLEDIDFIRHGGA